MPFAEIRSCSDECVCHAMSVHRFSTTNKSRIRYALTIWLRWLPRQSMWSAPHRWWIRPRSRAKLPSVDHQPQRRPVSPTRQQARCLRFDHLLVAHPGAVVCMCACMCVCERVLTNQQQSNAKQYQAKRMQNNTGQL